MHTTSTGQQERDIIAAARREFAEVGVRRANMDRIARLSGVSRSTLYRRFPGKDELLAKVSQEFRDAATTKVFHAVDGLGLEDAVAEAFVVALGAMQEDPVVRRVLETEPEIVESVIGLRGPGVGAYLKHSIDLIVQTLRAAGATMTNSELERVAETYVRITLSIVQVPVATVDFTQPAQAREYAVQVLAPMVR